MPIVVKIVLYGVDFLQVVVVVKYFLDHSPHLARLRIWDICYCAVLIAVMTNNVIQAQNIKFTIAHLSRG